MKRASLSFLIGAPILGWSAFASADTLTLHFNTPYTSSVFPGGTAPYMTAVFDDTAGGVRMTLSTAGLTEPQFVTDWYFNLDPSLNVNLLSFALDAGATTAVDPDKYVFNKSADSLDLGGQAVGFDFGPAFGTENEDGTRFNWNETFSGILTTTESGKTLTAASFQFLNTGSDFYGIAKVQGIPPKDDSTKLGAWVADYRTTVVPLPAAVWGGMALFGLVGAVKYRRSGSAA